MNSPTVWVRQMRRWLVAVALWQVSAMAFALTLTPERMTLTGPGNQGLLTISIAEPQPFAVTVVLSTTPDGIVSLPTTVTIAPFQTTTNTTVTALVDAATAIITGTLGGDSDATEVTIGYLGCQNAVDDAVGSANAYIAKVQAVEPACRVQGKACNKAVSAANSALKALTASNKAVGAACKQ